VPLRADGLPLRAFRSPGSRLAAPIGLPEASLSGVCRTEAPRSQLRDSSGLSPDSLGALIRILAGPMAHVGGGQAQVGVDVGRRHCEVKPVRHQRQLEVGAWKAGPRASHDFRETIALAQRSKQGVDVQLLATQKSLDIEGARVILGMVS
jgi:hypothetical protein